MDIDTADLIARCLSGDDVAKAEFILAYGGLVGRAVARALSTMSTHAPIRQDVEDITNDVLVHLLERECAMLGQIRDRLCINAWLGVVARNHTIDYIRRWSGRMRLQGAVVREAPAEYRAPAERFVIDEETRGQVQAYLAELPPHEKLALELYYTHEMKYAEISAITGSNINTVATRIRRARERLRGLVQAAPPVEEA